MSEKIGRPEGQKERLRNTIKEAEEKKNKPHPYLVHMIDGFAYREPIVIPTSMCDA
jgi:hypothetical protein